MGVIVLLWASLGQAWVQSEGQLQNLRVEKKERVLKVLIHLNRMKTFEKFTLDNPPRLVIDFFQVKEFFCDSNIPVDHWGIKEIRVGKYEPDITRVVFDFTEKQPLYEIKRQGERLVVSFWKEEVPKKSGSKEEKIKKAFPKEEPPLQEKKNLRKEEKKEEVLSKQVPSSGPKFREKRGTTVHLSLQEGFYFMHSAHFQEVYGKGMWFIGGEVGFRFPVIRENHLSFLMGFNHIKGYGEGSYKKSRVQMTPISLSVVYLREMGRFTPYIGVGVDYYNFSEDSPEVYENPLYSKETWGGNVQLGAYISLFPSLSLNLFGRYHEVGFQEGPLDLELGGNEYGLSLSYNFQI